MSSLDRVGPAERDVPAQSTSNGMPLTTTALRSALQAQLRARSRTDAPELRRLASILANEARRRSLLAEQLVVLVKQTWRTLDDADASDRRHPELIDGLIGLCIEEYYRGARED